MNRIKQLRLEKELTQREIAGVLEIDRSTLSYYESGKVNMTSDKLIKLADVFGVSIDYLLNLTDNKHRY